MATSPTLPGHGGTPPRRDATVPDPGSYTAPPAGSLGRRRTMIEGADDPSAPSGVTPENPLAGFLVSFSRTEAGEFWPLREGNNSLGGSPENDIVLPELRVSGKHANVNIRHDPGTDAWKFQLVDLSSSNGTYLDGERLDIFTGVGVAPNAKIRIGGYELLLLAADKFAQNLTRNEAFKPSQPAFDYSARDHYGENRTRPAY